MIAQNVKPTHHKTMIAQEITDEYINLHSDIEKLLDSALNIIMTMRLH
jgi:hypothetical protein